MPNFERENQRQNAIRLAVAYEKYAPRLIKPVLETSPEFNEKAYLRFASRMCDPSINTGRILAFLAHSAFTRMIDHEVEYQQMKDLIKFTAMFLCCDEAVDRSVLTFGTNCTTFATDTTEIIDEKLCYNQFLRDP